MISKGVTFVIMPLIALIEDNLAFVKNLNISAISLTTYGGDNTRDDPVKVNDVYNKI